MSDKLLVQLEHPITGEYIYPKVLESGIILDDGMTLGGYIKDIKNCFVRIDSDISDTDYKANDAVNVENLKLIQIQKLNNVFYKLRYSKEEVIFCHMGDSLTFGVDTTNGVETTYTYSNNTTYTGKQSSITYPLAMETYLKKVYGDSSIGNHVNRGRGGDWASNGYIRHNGKHNGDITLIMYGTNDSRLTSCPYVGDVEKYLYWMEQIIIRELLWGKAVVLLTSPIVRAGTGDMRVDVFSNAVKILGSKYCIPVIDTQEILYGYNYEIWSDATHLNKKGYSILGTRLASAFIGEGLTNQNNIYGGCIIPINGNRAGYVLKGNVNMAYGSYSNTDTSNEYLETSGYYCAIKKEGDNNEITFSFYTNEENLYVIPSLYLYNNTSLKITLDNGYVGENQLASSVYLNSNTLSNNTSFKIIENNTSSSLRYNKKYCKEKCEEPLKIPNKGWHTLTISIATKNDNESQTLVGCVYGIEFVSFDCMKQILSSPVFMFSNGNINYKVDDIIELNNDITKFNKLIIQTGLGGSKTISTSICKPFGTYNFRVNEDIINCQTENGRFKATIESNNQIKIIQSDDYIRCIFGVKE